VRFFHPLQVSDISGFKKKTLDWAAGFEYCCIYDSNSDPSPYTSYDFIAAAGCLSKLVCDPGKAFRALRRYHASAADYLFGYFSYDLKNELEKLESNKADGLGFPGMVFFQPQYLVMVRNGRAEVGVADEKFDPEKFLAALDAASVRDKLRKTPVHIRKRVTREDYLRNVNAIKRHIRQGDIYELNYCMEFFAEEALIDPLQAFHALNRISQPPFSSYCRFDDKYLVSASPERFLKKTGNKVISQPIKGTARRGQTPEEDERIRAGLRDNPKEQSENVMIVDLVRNDLSRSAKKETVRVEELFGVYTFMQVHQMISTISAELRSGVHFLDVIRDCFPMGSMTGAPKVRAMELIEQYEASRRGLFSGAMGYITPSGDFDFNVVIRSILYNAGRQYLSFMVGSAITDGSEPEREYDECLLKARALFEVLGQNT